MVSIPTCTLYSRPRSKQSLPFLLEILLFLQELPLVKSSALGVWYDHAAKLEEKLIGKDKKIEFKSVEEWKSLVEKKKELGERLLTQYAQDYTSSRGQHGDIKMLYTTQRSGTAADKVSALSILIGDNAVANLRSIDSLLDSIVKMARKMLIDGDLDKSEEETHYDFDLFVIGAGSAGVCASRFSAQSGAKESPRKHRGQQDSAEPSQNGSAAHSSQNGGSSTPHSTVNQTMAMLPISAAGVVSGVPGPATNLNIGMDYWGAAPSSAIPAMHGKVPSTPVQGGMVPTGSRDGVQSQLWIQDERELKRQRRKQSNRESARRSRLRKQAECDELAQRAESLKDENASLRAELAHIRSEYERLLAQNTSLKERIGESGEEDMRCSQDDDEHSGNDAQYCGQTNHMQSV